MNDKLRKQAEERIDNKLEFYRNFKAYVIVNLTLAFINWLFSPEFWWVLFPVFFCGIGVICEFLKAFVLADNFDSQTYREKKILKEMGKLRD